MDAKDYVKQLDWNSAIAEATLDLDIHKSGQPKKTTQLTEEEDYLYRGIARCFVTNKDGNYKEAIGDLSMAITLNVNNVDAYHHRAYAFYLDGNYEKAKVDCDKVIALQKSSAYTDELLGKIYNAMGKYAESAEWFGKAVKYWHSQGTLPSPSLLDSYREACKRMNNV